MKKATIVAALLASIFALAGCAGGGAGGGTLSQDGSRLTESGFLSNYGRLVAVEGREGAYRYVDHSANFRSYRKVMVEPVQVFLTQDPEYKGLQPEAMARMSEAFRMEFVGALASTYQVVKAPGPDVLRLRLAITGVQPTRPDLNPTDFIPIKAVFNVAREAAGGAPRVAEISAELQVLDGQGRIVAEGMATRRADKALTQGERITWADLQGIVAVWAKNFRAQLDQARGYAGN
ncbi:MAG: DUF3313 domain-containing protein [Rhodocyclaceae bacterium]|nr:DUF3313 domain-containing protein [Rhodocyclaceae bacterium]